MNFNQLYNILEEGSAPRTYSCLMVDLSSLQSQVNELHEAICPCDVYDDTPGHGLETEFHCTVKYGIHSYYKPYDVYSQIDIVPVTLKFKGLSLFENEKYDVLKFDILSKDLVSLNSEVSNKLDCTDTYPVYHPHATVAYLRPGTGKFYTDLENEITGITITATRFIFSNPNSEKVFWDV